MPTYISSQSAENMVRAISGSHYLLFEDGGHTGSLDLHGPARIDYVNASGLAVQNSLNVTGNQAVFGNLTGFNFNHFARIVCTGDAYLNNVTGNLKIAGNVDLNNNLRVTGATHISGSLFVNGVQITGNGSGGESTGFFTGDFASLYANRGDFLVGTGAGLYGVFNTGGASSGDYLIFDPSLGEIPYRLGTIASASQLTHFTESGNSALSVFKSTGTNIHAGFVFNGNGSILLGQSLANLAAGGVNNLFFGNANSASSSAQYSAVFGSNNQSVGADNAILFGSDGIAYSDNELAQGGGLYTGGGRAQSSVFIFKGITENDTPLNIGSISFEAGQCIALRCFVSAIEENVGPAIGLEGAAYELRVIYKNEASTISIIGTQSKTIITEDDATWDVNITDGADLLYVTVTGPASPQNVRWIARVEANIISF